MSASKKALKAGVTFFSQASRLVATGTRSFATTPSPDKQMQEPLSKADQQFSGRTISPWAGAALLATMTGFAVQDALDKDVEGWRPTR